MHWIINFCVFIPLIDGQLVDHFLNNIGSIIGVPLASASANKIPVENRLVLNYQLNQLQTKVNEMKRIQAHKMLMQQKLSATVPPQFSSLHQGNSPPLTVAQKNSPPLTFAQKNSPNLLLPYGNTVDNLKVQSNNHSQNPLGLQTLNAEASGHIADNLISYGSSSSAFNPAASNVYSPKQSPSIYSSYAAELLASQPGIQNDFGANPSATENYVFNPSDPTINGLNPTVAINSHLSNPSVANTHVVNNYVTERSDPSDNNIYGSNYSGTSKYNSNGNPYVHRPSAANSYGGNPSKAIAKADPIDIIQRELLETGGRKWLSFLAGTEPNQIEPTTISPPLLSLFGATIPSPQVSWGLPSLPSRSTNIANVNDFLSFNNQFSAISDLARQISHSLPNNIPRTPKSPKLAFSQLSKPPNLVQDALEFLQLKNRPAQNLLFNVRKLKKELKESRERIRTARIKKFKGSKVDNDFEREVEDTLERTGQGKSRIIVENSQSNRYGHVTHTPFTKDNNEFSISVDSPDLPAGELLAKNRDHGTHIKKDASDGKEFTKFRKSTYPSNSKIEIVHFDYDDNVAGELVARDRDQDPLQEFLEIDHGNWPKKYNQPLLGKQWRYSGPSRIGDDEKQVFPSRPTNFLTRNIRNSNSRLRRLGQYSRSVVDDLVNYFSKG